MLLDFDSQLGGLATGDPEAVLQSTQTNLEPWSADDRRPAPAGGLRTRPLRGSGAASASRAGQGRAGWAFATPQAVLIGLFVLIPISWRSG